MYLRFAILYDGICACRKSGLVFRVLRIMNTQSVSQAYRTVASNILYGVVVHGTGSDNFSIKKSSLLFNTVPYGTVPYGRYLASFPLMLVVPFETSLESFA